MEVKIKEPDTLREKNHGQYVIYGLAKKEFPVLEKFNFLSGDNIPRVRYRGKLAVKRKGG